MDLIRWYYNSLILKILIIGTIVVTLYSLISSMISDSVVFKDILMLAMAVSIGCVYVLDRNSKRGNTDMCVWLVIGGQIVLSIISRVM